jgi:hypothetical protein
MRESIAQAARREIRRRNDAADMADAAATHSATGFSIDEVTE